MTSLRFFALVSALAAVSLSLHGQTTVPIASYSFNVSPGDPNHNDGRYADGSFTKLKDGIATVPVWGGSSSSVDVSPLVGWQNAVQVRFEFSAPVAIQTATFYFADSNGAAGVAFPRELTLLNSANNGPGSMSVSDPSGAGSTMPVTFNLNGLVTDHLILGIPAQDFVGGWTMMTEATFTTSAIPEPSTYAAIAGAMGLGVAVWRKRKRKGADTLAAA